MMSGLLLAVLVTAAPELRVAYVATTRCAPLYNACLESREFSRHYGLSLVPVRPPTDYQLVERGRPSLEVRLVRCATDSEAYELVRHGHCELGLLNVEAVLAGVLRREPVRILAPVQNRGDMLVVGPTMVADSWQDFLKSLRGASSVVPVGYLGKESISMLALEWALKLENIPSACDGVPDTCRVDLRRYGERQKLARDLAAGVLAAAVVQEPDAVALEQTQGVRRVCEIHDLPPNWFAGRPGVVAAAADSVVAARRGEIERLLEVLAVATHYTNNHSHRTAVNCARWLGTASAQESTALAVIGFTSVPTFGFKDGVWNWYFAQRLRGAVPVGLDSFMSVEDWLGVPWDSFPGRAARERAGARIVPRR